MQNQRTKDEMSAWLKQVEKINKKMNGVIKQKSVWFGEGSVYSNGTTIKNESLSNCSSNVLQTHNF